MGNQEQMEIIYLYNTNTKTDKCKNTIKIYIKNKNLFQKRSWGEFSLTATNENDKTHTPKLFFSLFLWENEKVNG